MIKQKDRLALSLLIDAPDDLIGLIIACLPDVVHAILGLFQAHKPDNDSLIKQILNSSFNAEDKIKLIAALYLK